MNLIPISPVFRQNYLGHTSMKLVNCLKIYGIEMSITIEHISFNSSTWNLKILRQHPEDEMITENYITLVYKTINKTKNKTLNFYPFCFVFIE